MSSAVDMGLGLDDEADSELVSSFTETPLGPTVCGLDGVATAVAVESALRERTGPVSEIPIL